MELIRKIFRFDGRAVAWENQSSGLAVLKSRDEEQRSFFGEKELLTAFKTVDFKRKCALRSFYFHESLFKVAVMRGDGDGAHIEIDVQALIGFKKFDIDSMDRIFGMIT